MPFCPLQADSVYDSGGGETIQLRNGGCIIERTVATSARTYNSIRSWYPVNTSCQYRFTAPMGEIIRLEFSQFRVERVTFCEEVSTRLHTCCASYECRTVALIMLSKCLKRDLLFTPS